MDGKNKYHQIVFFFFCLTLNFYLLHLNSQKDFVCFDFVPRHHNIIRYRKGQAMRSDRFATVCSWTMFEDSEEWMYDILIG